jgi:hypothetical protein
MMASSHGLVNFVRANASRFAAAALAITVIAQTAYGISASASRPPDPSTAYLGPVAVAVVALMVAGVLYLAYRLWRRPTRPSIVIAAGIALYSGAAGAFASGPLVLVPSLAAFVLCLVAWWWDPRVPAHFWPPVPPPTNWPPT